MNKQNNRPSNGNNKLINKNSNSNNTSFPYIKVNILYVAIFILLCVIGYFIYVFVSVKYETSVVTFIQNELLARRNGKDSKLILSTQTPVSLYGNEYNISLWVKVLSYTYRYGAPKYILRKGGMEVYLHPTQNNLHVRVSRLNIENTEPEPTTCDNPEGCIFSPATTTTTNEGGDNTTTTTEAFTDLYPVTQKGLLELNKMLDCVDKTNICDNKVNYKHNPLLDRVVSQYKNTESFEGESEPTSPLPATETTSPSEPEYDECVQFDLPLQKWTHVSINYFSDNIDVYVDGKLSTSCKLNIIPNINLSNMIISPDGGFEGEVAKVTYSNVKLNSKQIYNLYKASPV